MKRLILAASLVLAVSTPGMAQAEPFGPGDPTVPPIDAPTGPHANSYLRAYQAVVRQFGHRTPGRNIVYWGFAPGRASTDVEVVNSTALLHRMLAPPPVVTAPATTTTSGSSSSVSPGSGLAACIVQHESSGNPQDVTGQYSGLADWSQSSWAGGGGTRYAPTPTQASPAQQMTVLNNMLANGQSGQWTPYDGC